MEFHKSNTLPACVGTLARLASRFPSMLDDPLPNELLTGYFDSASFRGQRPQRMTGCHMQGFAFES